MSLNLSTISSVSRTVNFSLSIFRAKSIRFSSPAIERSTRACPADISLRKTNSLISSGKLISLKILATVDLVFPKWSANSCWVRLNSFINLSKAVASSMGFRSSLWIFSIRDISNISLSVTLLTTAGISFNSAILAAHQRLSPATNW